MAEVFYKAIAFVKTTIKAAYSWKVSSQNCVLYIGFKIIRNLKSITNVQTKCQVEYILKKQYIHNFRQNEAAMEMLLNMIL